MSHLRGLLFHSSFQVFNGIIPLKKCVFCGIKSLKKCGSAGSTVSGQEPQVREVLYFHEGCCFIK